MGDFNVENSNRKRVRDDSGELESDSPELKRVNVHVYTEPTPSESVRVNAESNQAEHESDASSLGLTLVEPEAELGASGPRMIREDILDILEDTETASAIQDLDSVIRSFEEEILQASPSVAQQAVVELTSDSGDSQPDLGYLLEASDDELGLPPTVTSSKVQAPNEPGNTSLGNADVLVGLANMPEFEDDLQSYDTFGLALGERSIEGENYAGNSTGDFVTVDGLFDDGLFDYPEPSDFSDFGWRPESLPAL